MIEFFSLKFSKIIRSGIKGSKYTVGYNDFEELKQCIEESFENEGDNNFKKYLEK